jgi:hypothetical protein
LLSVASEAVKMRIQNPLGAVRCRMTPFPEDCCKRLWWAHKDSNLGPAD